ncbi:MAG: arsenite efflux transporter membrane subunit ArsB [Candidatus Bipolaricaulota bacterium]
MLAVALIFLVSCGATIALTLRRPYLYLRARRRQLRVETYFLGALLGPALILAGGLLTGQQLLDGLNGDSGLQPLGILTLFISMVFMSIFLDITGFFEACARAALRYARADGTRLFFALYGVVSLLTVFTSNDIVILTLTPFVYYFARHAGVNPRPYLVAEFFAANTWSMALYIGNPTNILLASRFGFTFVGYTGWMILPTLVAGGMNALLLYLVFRKEIRRPIRPVDLKPSEAITDWAGAVLGLLALGGCVVALAIAPYLGWEMWRVSLAFALALLAVLVLRESYARALRRQVSGSTVLAAMRRVPWPIVPFVLSLFVTVYALRVYGVTGRLGDVLLTRSGGSVPLLAILYGVSSALAANVLNNIPMTLAFASATGALSGIGLRAAALGTAIGSNLGANLTPIGALAGIMWMTILAEKELRITFAEFVKYGLLVTPASLLACLGVLALQLAVGS